MSRISAWVIKVQSLEKTLLRTSKQQCAYNGIMESKPLAHFKYIQSRNRAEQGQGWKLHGWAKGSNPTAAAGLKNQHVLLFSHPKFILQFMDAERFLWRGSGGVFLAGWIPKDSSRPATCILGTCLALGNWVNYKQSSNKYSSYTMQCKCLGKKSK